MAFKDTRKEYDRIRSRKPMKRQQQIAIIKRRNNKTQGRENHGKRWTEQEIAFLWNVDYTIQEIAALLHRTYCAISAARVNFAAKRPEDYRHNGNRRLEIKELP